MCGVLGESFELWWQFDFIVSPMVAPAPGLQDENRQAFRKKKKDTFSHTAPEFLCLLLTLERGGCFETQQFWLCPLGGSGAPPQRRQSPLPRLEVLMQLTNQC